MNSLAVLQGASVSKPIINFDKLSVGEYLIYEFALVQTKYGLRVRADLGKTYIYLPERYAKSLNSDHIDDLNKSTKVMIYSGKDPQQQKRYVY